MFEAKLKVSDILWPITLCEKKPSRPHSCYVVTVVNCLSRWITYWIFWIFDEKMIVIVLATVLAYHSVNVLNRVIRTVSLKNYHWSVQRYRFIIKQMTSTRTWCQALCDCEVSDSGVTDLRSKPQSDGSYDDRFSLPNNKNSNSKFTSRYL